MRRRRAYTFTRGSSIMGGMTAKSRARGESEIQLATIAAAYDQAVERFRAGVSDEDLLPRAFIRSARYRRLRKTLEAGACGSENPKIRAYLAPKAGMRFLDIGSGVNLVEKRLGDWPSTYYGIDISPALLAAARGQAARRKTRLGGLFLADASRMPFEAVFFDIAAAIGVLEYYDLEYIRRALRELRRVMKPGSRVAVDMPTTGHPDLGTLVELEALLGRTRPRVPTNAEFEDELRKSFSIEEADRSSIMTLYFVRKRD